MTFVANRRLNKSLELFRTNAPEDALPDLPEDPTGIDDRGLMELFSALSAWCEYADELYAEACGNEQDAEENYTAVQSMHAMRSDRKTVTAQRAAASQHEEVQRAAGEKRAAYRNRKRAEAAVKKAERRLSVVSRELTRRAASVRGRL